MNTPTQAPYRPRKTNNPAIDEAFRKAFDYIYVLQAQVNTLITKQNAATTVAQTKAASTTQGTTAAQVKT